MARRERPRTALHLSLRSGDWVVAVWRSPSSHAFAPGTYLESVEVTCDRTQAREAAAVYCHTHDDNGWRRPFQRGRAVARGRSSMRRTRGLPDQHRQRDDDARVCPLEPRGVCSRISDSVSSPLSLDEAAHFKLTGGVLVREVWEGSQAAFADLRPGDVIAVEDIDRLIAPVAAGQEMLLVKRGSREAKVALSRNSSDTGPSQEGDASTLGLVWERPNVGFPIESVVPGSAADKAGVRGGDVLLRINHVEPKDLAQVRRLLAGRGSKTAFIELARDGRRVGMLVF